MKFKVTDGHSVLLSGAKPWQYRHVNAGDVFEGTLDQFQHLLDANAAELLADEVDEVAVQEPAPEPPRKRGRPPKVGRPD